LTGASTGIGFATVKYLINRNIYVFATVRTSQDALKVLSLGEGVCPIELDVCDAERSKEIAHLIGGILSRSGRHQLDALINNAGIALGGPLIELDDETMRRQLEVNLIAPMRLIRFFAEYLGVRRGNTKGGRVIQVSSISGEQAMAFVGPYTASKFALEGLTDSLRFELMPFGIDVISVKPGPINTEIWGKAPTPEESPFDDGLYKDSLRIFYDFVVKGGRKGLPPIEIAKVIHRALTSRQPKTHYTRTPEYFTRLLIPRLLSTKRFNRIIGKLFHLTPELFNHADSHRSGEEFDRISDDISGGDIKDKS
jgi:NAD(P)-dependent dehydrogenase (short-subunit alcohol dehydrogenase family)